jgi:hypothetical protein
MLSVGCRHARARPVVVPDLNKPRYDDAARALESTAVLVTGADKHIGCALLCRLLLDPDIKVKRIVVLVYS